MAQRTATTQRAFERSYATRRIRAQAGVDESVLRRRPTLIELTRTKFADEQDPLRYVEEERVRVEALRLRNKLAQNRVETQDDAGLRALTRLRERLRIHALELDSLRRIFSSLREFKGTPSPLPCRARSRLMQMASRRACSTRAPPPSPSLNAVRERYRRECTHNISPARQAGNAALLC